MAAFGHFRQKQNSLCIGVFSCISLQFRNRTCSNNSENVMCDTVKKYSPPVGNMLCSQHISDAPINGCLGSWICHLPFEMKDPRYVFPKWMLKPFPSLSLAPQQVWGNMVQGLLHIWLLEKKGCFQGAVTQWRSWAEQGRLQVRQAGDGERGHGGTVGFCGVGAAGVLDSRPVEGRLWQVRIQDEYLQNVPLNSKGFCPSLLPHLPCVHIRLCTHARAHTHTHTPGAQFSDSWSCQKLCSQGRPSPVPVLVSLFSLIKVG